MREIFDVSCSVLNAFLCGAEAIEAASMRDNGIDITSPKSYWKLLEELSKLCDSARTITTDIETLLMTNDNIPPSVSLAIEAGVRLLHSYALIVSELACTEDIIKTRHREVLSEDGEAIAAR